MTIVIEVMMKLVEVAISANENKYGRRKHND